MHDVGVLCSEFDAYGYDPVVARGCVVRNIQFKTRQTHRPGRVPLARRWSRSRAAAPCGSG